MFKGKVYVYRNNNWKEEEFEKEFDNPQEFNNFRKTYRQPEFGGPFMWLWDRAHLQNYFNNLIDRRFGLWGPEEPQQEYICLPEGVDLGVYEDALQKKEHEEAENNRKLQWFKNGLIKLEEMKKRFEEEWDKDMIKKINKDIEATQKEIDALEK